MDLLVHMPWSSGEIKLTRTISLLIFRVWNFAKNFCKEIYFLLAGINLVFTYLSQPLHAFFNLPSSHGWLFPILFQNEISWWLSFASFTVAAVFIQNCTDQGVCEHLVKSVTELANNPKRGKDLVALGIIPPLLSCLTRTFNSHTTSQSLLVAIHELLSKLGPKGLKSIS